MASTAARLHEVESLRQARLEAQAYAFQLEQAQNELGHLRQQAAVQQHQQHQVDAEARSHCAGGAGCAAAEALREARLEAADSRFKQQLTELELAKQLDQLQELQWQLECVVAQLGMEPASMHGAAGGGAQPPQQQSVGSGVDHMLLLGKVENLRQAQVQLGDYKRRLAAAEEQLQRQQQQPLWQRQQPSEEPAFQAGGAGPGGPDWRQTDCAERGGNGGSVHASRSEAQGAGSRQLVGELLHENEALRQRLAEAEDSYRSLERDYEVELLQRADAEEAAEERTAAAAAAAIAGSTPGSPAGVSPHGQTQMHLRASHLRVSRLAKVQPSAAVAGEADWGSGGEGLTPGGKLRQGPAVSQSMEHIACQRLSFRLQEKDKQLAKLAGVVRELEGKLIEARKQQADMFMKDSSWREQEALDRRLAQMEDERARLQFAATAAQAEAEAARKEATAQRRMLKRLQEQAAAAAAAAGGSGGADSRGGQMADLLQKRVKVLEAQNIRLRLQARSSKEEEDLAAADAAAASARERAQQCRAGVAAGNEAPQLAAESSAGSDGGAAGENEPPNREAAGAAGEGSSVLDIPFARWEADKRLQRRVETLQTRLREKTTALVSADAGRRRAEEQLEGVHAAAQQAQAALAQTQARLRVAEERAVPGTHVPVAYCQGLLRELEALQQQYDELGRRYAALQHRMPSTGGDDGRAGCEDGSTSGQQEEQHSAPAPAAAGAAPNAAGLRCSSMGTGSIGGLLPGSSASANALRDSSLGGGGAAGPPPGMSTSTLRSSSSKSYLTPYCPGDYGGGSAAPPVPPASGTASAAALLGCRLPVPEPAVAAQLLEKDVALFDAHLQREQASAEAERHHRRLHTLLTLLSPHPTDSEAAAAIAEARQLAGLPPLPSSAAQEGCVPAQAAGKPGGKPAAAGGKAKGGAAAGGKRRQPSVREQELLDTVALLKSALERTKKGLESGVSSAKYMAAVDRAKQLKAQCQELEARLEDAAKVRDELARVQRELGALHGTASGLRSQLKAAKEQREEAGSAREHMLGAQVSELERALRERDAQMEALSAGTQQVDEEVRVLVAEGLRPADLIQELLILRPRVRELEGQTSMLSGELAGLEEALAHDMAALQADHELLRRQCGRWEGEIRALCARHGEPLPLGLD